MLYSKLFIVLGILWVFECVHYLAHGHHRDMECVSITEFFLRIIGCVNLLRGCLIFAIFVCKDSILEKVNNLLKINQIIMLLGLEVENIWCEVVFH